MNIAESVLRCDLCADFIYEELCHLSQIAIGVYDCQSVFYLGKRLIACPKCIKALKEEKGLREIKK